MECHTDPQSECENCILCAASNRAHSWRNSGRGFVDRVRQKGKTGAEYVLQGISERSDRYEMAYPKTFGLLINSGRKILTVGKIVLEYLQKVYRNGVSSAKSVYANMKSASIPLAQGMKRFPMNYPKCFYFCGSAMVTAGIFLFVLTMFDINFCYYSSIFFICSIVLMFGGGFITWLPAFYLSDSSRHQNHLHDRISQVQLIDKPPTYESLPPAFLPTLSLEEEAPPTYEEISASNQGLLQTSDCGLHQVLPCALNQPAENPLTHNVQNMVDTITILPIETTEPAVLVHHPIPSRSQPLPSVNHHPQPIAI